MGALADVRHVERYKQKGGVEGNPKLSYGACMLLQHEDAINEEELFEFDALILTNDVLLEKLTTVQDSRMCNFKISHQATVV